MAYVKFNLADGTGSITVKAETIVGIEQIDWLGVGGAACRIKTSAIIGEDEELMVILSGTTFEVKLNLLEVVDAIMVAKSE
jgi:hypothetical protein